MSVNLFLLYLQMNSKLALPSFIPELCSPTRSLYLPPVSGSKDKSLANPELASSLWSSGLTKTFKVN